MRLTVFISIILAGLFLPLWLFLAVALCYAFWKPAYELILLGMFLDAQFGIGVSNFTYTYMTTLGLIVVCVEFAKPHLIFYRV